MFRHYDAAVALVVSGDYVRDRIIGLLDLHACVREGEFMEKAGRLHEAEGAYRLALKFLPDYGPARAGLDRVLVKTGRQAGRK